MRVTEKLQQQNMKKKSDLRNMAEDEEETMTYRKRKTEHWSINRAEDAFVSPMAEGLNSRGSVFDRQAVFRTKQ